MSSTTTPFRIWARFYAACTATQPETLRAVIDDAAAAIDDQIGAIRDLIADLNPVTLTQLGLPAALETVRDRAEQHPDAPTITLTVTPHASTWSRLPTDVEQACYRVIQEALNNSLRHAHAQHLAIDLALDSAQSAIEVAVVDDGTGFDAGPHSRGHGLANIATRVHLMRGDLVIDGNRGTRISATLPTHSRQRLLRRLRPGR